MPGDRCVVERFEHYAAHQRRQGLVEEVERTEQLVTAFRTAVGEPSVRCEHSCTGTYVPQGGGAPCRRLMLLCAYGETERARDPARAAEVAERAATDILRQLARIWTRRGRAPSVVELAMTHAALSRLELVDAAAVRAVVSASPAMREVLESATEAVQSDEPRGHPAGRPRRPAARAGQPRGQREPAPISRCGPPQASRRSPKPPAPPGEGGWGDASAPREVCAGKATRSPGLRSSIAWLPSAVATAVPATKQVLMPWVHGSLWQSRAAQDLGIE